MFKQELRRIFLDQRKNLSKKKRIDLNAKIKDQFLKVFSDDITSVHIFLPIRSKLEVDTWSIIHALWKRDVSVTVPVIQENDNLIRSCLLTKNTELKENKWGVQEPATCQEIENTKIDAVVLPLLAYDDHGYRVGYGKGYYDTFLQSIQAKVIKIGLSFFPPVDKISDTKTWDVKMDYCITPEKVFKF